ncbi:MULTISPECIES: ParA family protein [Bacillus cereus group]|uniref:ParA family protein n=1 Tax=Bacillus cereus group TaxID=86661 RepID=UPI0025A594D4|nr:ParA family protein [Bacillus thuringiensis]MDM8365455.1 ParA family protein [Bacillus thuringiensis]
MTKVITFANFKGGVGKTTAATLFSYLLQEQGKKVVLLDFDPQANATEILFETFGYDSDIEVTLFEAIKEKNLAKSIINLTENLDVLPSELDLVGFPEYLHEFTNEKSHRYWVLDMLLADLKGKYDFIIIDVPPTISEFTNNAIVASDYVNLIMQTHQQSFASTVKFIDYLRDIQEVNPDIDLLGVIPYLVKKRGKIDNEVLEEASSIFKNRMFSNHIMQRERIKLFSKNGITNEDMHDKSVLEMYQHVVDEFLERIES